jgi:hypothetical protein
MVQIRAFRHKAAGSLAGDPWAVPGAAARGVERFRQSDVRASTPDSNLLMSFTEFA